LQNAGAKNLDSSKGESPCWWTIFSRPGGAPADVSIGDITVEEKILSEDESEEDLGDNSATIPIRGIP
jgi:hypothetical protein